MSAASHPTRRRLQAAHARAWRDPFQVAGQWLAAERLDPRLLRYTARGDWWDVLAATGVTLLVTREYEHLVMALRVDAAGPVVTFLPLPHPSGLVVDRGRGTVYVASTRNPNLVFDLAPAHQPRSVVGPRHAACGAHPLLPVRARYLPGRLYLHDLALVGGVLHANAVGENAVIRLDAAGGHERVWWPRCIDRATGPAFDRNYLQLNSIAAGLDLAGSFFSASTDALSTRRPGHRNFPVDRRGVIFSGQTREPIARGLTRPHSARLRHSKLWVDNSGYGEVGVIEQGQLEVVARLPGWTRGLCFHEGVAFVGTSRVLPRFRSYAPGLDVDRSVCGLHAVDTGSGRVLGSVLWPYGNQVFAVDWISGTLSGGLPLRVGARRAPARERALFYSFAPAVPAVDPNVE